MVEQLIAMGVKCPQEIQKRLEMQKQKSSYTRSKKPDRALFDVEDTVEENEKQDRNRSIDPILK